MARIPLSSGFTLPPEGIDIFRIYDVEYKESFGKIVIKLVNAKGITHMERFNIKNSKGELCEGALNAFSYFAKNAVDDFTLDDIDPVELIDRYICGEVVYTSQPNRDDPSKTVTFANLKNLSSADGFAVEPTQRALTLGKESGGKVTTQPTNAPLTSAQPPVNEGKLDLDALLGGI